MTADRTDEFHPIANLFPLMGEDELAQLAADIAANGLHEPIWRHKDGRIIDGRNRWRACQLAGVEARHRTYDKGDDTIVAWVVSKNLHRRHLTTAQRNAIGLDIANLDVGRPGENPPNGGISQPAAATIIGGSVRGIQRAAELKRVAPDLHEKVKRGEIKPGEARAAIAAATTPSPAPDPAPDYEKEALFDDPQPNNGDLAFAAIKAVARLKISGTAAGRDCKWTDDEIAMAEKAATWLRMFVHNAKRERNLAEIRARRSAGEVIARGEEQVMQQVAS